MKTALVSIAMFLLCIGSQAQSRKDEMVLNVEKVGILVNMTWAAAIQPETNHFEIQRSEDGSTWKTVAIMFPYEDNLKPHAYRYAEKMVKRSDAYYRIRQVDINKNENFTAPKYSGASSQ
jgi:hypothetical protein